MKTTVAVSLIAFLGHAAAHAAPLKVYILAGQSNMQGHASVSTFDYLAKDPKTAPLLAEMRGKDGKPKVCDRVWVSYLSQDRNGKDTIMEGKLTAGFAARADTIGPEFTFGITMEKLGQEDILLIKTAWGGKSLHTDFRPPSASAEGAGVFYKLMIDHVKKVLEDPKKVVPSYNAKDGYQIAGFLWFQGWNDLVDQKAYPQRGKPGGYDHYAEYLAHFIRDVRKDLNVPKLPFVIGVLGVNGPVDTFPSPRYQPIYQSFRAAMAAPAAMPEFKGTVAAVLTEQFWDHALADARDKKDRTPEEEEIAKGASNQGFHYYGAAKFFGPAGKAFAEAMVAMEDDHSLITLPIRFHLTQRATMTVKGQEMEVWVQPDDLTGVVIGEVNRIWKPANIQFTVERAEIEPLLRPDNFDELLRSIESSGRGIKEEPGSRRTGNIAKLLDPAHRHPTALNVYLLPYIGRSYQGYADIGGTQAVVGVWSDKSTGGENPPVKMLLVEPEPMKVGSLARTIAHELGHNLKLVHPDKSVEPASGRLMGGRKHGYSLTAEEIAIARESARQRPRL